MKIEADRDKCVGGGQCVVAAPDLFDQDDDGLVLVLEDAPGDDQRDDATTAASLCPARAIEIM